MPRELTLSTVNSEGLHSGKGDLTPDVAELHRVG